MGDARLAEQALITAVLKGEVDEVRRQLDLHPCLVDVRTRGDGYERTPLMMLALASMGDETEMKVAQALLEHGASVGLVDRFGWTALYLSCACGKVGLASLLLDSGADVSGRERPGPNALIPACYNGHLPVVDLIVARMGRDAPVNEQDHDGVTALWAACCCGYVDIARVLLLGAGADPSIKDEGGRTAADIAAQQGAETCVELLEWFEGEVLRFRLLHQARARHDRLMVTCNQGQPNVMLLDKGKCISDWPPGRSSESIPSEEGLHPLPPPLPPPTPTTDQQHQQDGVDGEEEEERYAVLDLVVTSLPNDLYIELAEGLWLGCSAEGVNGG